MKKILYYIIHALIFAICAAVLYLAPVMIIWGETPNGIYPYILMSFVFSAFSYFKKFIPKDLNFKRDKTIVKNTNKTESNNQDIDKICLPNDIAKQKNVVSEIMAQKENNDYSEEVKTETKTNSLIMSDDDVDKSLTINESKSQNGGVRYGIISLLAFILIISIIWMLTISSNFAIPQKNDTKECYKDDIERWDSQSATYSNFKYGFAFSLPTAVTWCKTPGSAKHTVVKFVQPDTELTIFVNINRAQKLKSNDIWDVYEFFVNSVEKDVLPTVEANTSEKISRFLHKKVTICGKHAVKVMYNSVKRDDRYNDEVCITTLDYTFVHNNSTYTLSIKCYDEVLEELNKNGITLEDFAKSFQIIPINSCF